MTQTNRCLATIPWRLAMGCAAAVWHFAPTIADACTSVPAASTTGVSDRGLLILPADGTTAPLNTSVWIVRSPWPNLGEDEPECVTPLVSIGDQPIDYDITRMTIAGEEDHELLRLTFAKGLPSGAQVTVTCPYAAAQGALTSTFLVGQEADDDPPEAPLVTLTSTRDSESSAGCACGSPTIVQGLLAQTAEDEFVLAIGTDESPPSDAPWRADRIWRGFTSLDQFTFTDLPRGRQELAFIAFDLVGNGSAATSLSFNIGGENSGCSGTGSGATGGLVGIAFAQALALFRRARRGQEG